MMFVMFLQELQATEPLNLSNIYIGQPASICLSLRSYISIKPCPFVPQYFQRLTDRTHNQIGHNLTQRHGTRFQMKLLLLFIDFTGFIGSLFGTSHR